MVGKEDASSNQRADSQRQPLSSRRLFSRSVSWSSSRTAPQVPETENKDATDPNGKNGVNDGKSRRYPPTLLTPRPQHNPKGRSCLPPLQPLSIARRSLDEWPQAGSDDIGEWPQSHPPTPSGNTTGDRLKLDISSIQWKPDKNGGLVKRDKIAFFDKKCSKVEEHIYLGGDAVAKDRDILKQNGITHVLNCVGFVCPEYFKSDFVYRTLWLQDSPSEDITSILYDVFDYFEDVREQGGRVFVHCCQGVSRSTSLVIAYLMWREGQSFEDALQYVKVARGIADPNMGFACQLLQCQKRVHAFPLSPSSLLRMYRIAPHSPYDPLHLVPKMLNDPSPSSLDYRGAFIVQIPAAVYLWIGNKCEPIMERDARGAVCQIVRYEKVQAPVTMLKEGDEPASFWAAFANLLPLMDKSKKGVESTGEAKPGSVQKRVDSYNLDFEIFQKAIKGGFVPPFASAENEHETHLPARESCWSVLRRKFAPGGMKEFVLAPKISLARMYSDSMMIVHSPSPSPSSASASSSLSSLPSFLSRDSISSDSSTSSTCFSESSLDSPSDATCSLSVSTTLSNFSNLTLSSPPLNPKSPEIVHTNCTLQISAQPMRLLCQKASDLLLERERRGSVPNCLKLPMISHNVKLMDKECNFHDCEGGEVRMNEDTFSLSGPDVEFVFDLKHDNRNGEGIFLQNNNSSLSAGRMANADSCNREANFVNSSGRPWTNTAIGDAFRHTISNKVEKGSQFRITEPLVCHFPSMEKVVKFSQSDLNSRSAFTIFIPSTTLGKIEAGTLYFWVGKYFHCGQGWNKLSNRRDLGSEVEIDWCQAGFDVLNYLGLPEDTPVKIIKEDEETVEFLSLLSTL